ncbi:uncharacterized protein N7479_008681 [Penicillium vulpinum]|uniref:Uncharacterized protein n=1 Tax=Penicillium vulpinum TaxID=29845 RepID=A0A1V6S137_9EURO|nr:uncharacterized protein N7479_008681 [Penicillium vulpinum]KAJ5950268.1 hypothetical protein N7479_008681 [Penicillium vulpinum]OQE07735.1 hypothetical protein PENVUL_c012G06116 [Penicillium vulpinum]
MSEDSVEFIRKLVACPELTESDIHVALTAAGVDELMPDGNRKLAHLGLGATGFLIDCSVAFMALSRDFTSKLKCRVNGNQHRADIAKRTGIDKHLKFHFRAGARSPGVLALATSALIGAIYRRKKSLTSVANGLYSLGVLDENVDGFSLMGIFKDEQSDLLLMPPSDQSNPVQTKQIDFFSHEDPALPDLATPPDLGCFSNFEVFYDETGQLKEVLLDELHFTGPASQSPLPEDLGRPVEGAHVSQNFHPFSLQEMHQGRLHEVEISPQQAKQNFLPSLAEDFHLMVNQPSSSRRSTGKRKDAGGTEKPKSKASCVDIGFRSSLCREAEMNRVLGLPHPDNTYFRPEIANKLLNLGPEMFPSLCIFLIGVGGSQSLVALRAALKYTRETRGEMHSVQSRRWISRDLTINERFKIISEIHENAAFLQILRCNHILHLYRCTGRSVGHSSNFAIEATPQDELIGQPRARGNPRKIEVAIAVNKMMENIFPDLKPGSTLYTSKRRVMLEFRKFGKRLHILAEFFGDAILCLLHFDRSVEVTSPVIIEKIILAPTEEVFENFVKILEESHGDILRELSRAAKSAFEHLLYEDRRRQNPFALEEMTTEDILKIPKGSQELLPLLQ